MTRTRSAGSSTVRSTLAVSPARIATTLVRVIVVYVFGSQVTLKVYSWLPAASGPVSNVLDAPAPMTTLPLTLSSAASAGTVTTTCDRSWRWTGGAAWGGRARTGTASTAAIRPVMTISLNNMQIGARYYDCRRNTHHPGLEDPPTWPKRVSHPSRSTSPQNR